MNKKIVAVIPVGTDPEAAASARLCSESGIPVHVPYCLGKACHTGNAYKADEIVPPIPAGVDEVWRVECDGPVFASRLLVSDPSCDCGNEGCRWCDPIKVVIIDHHRYGDTGYGKGPEEFLEASSIGQVVSHLAVLGLWTGAQFAPTGSLAGHIAYDSIGDWWVVATIPPDGPTVWAMIPDEIALCAAADHCLEAAYRGRCPGVDPDDLMVWRAESRAAFQKRPVEAVLADIEAAQKRLRAVTVEAGCRQCGAWRGDCGECSHVRCPEFADLRGESIPELPEAAAREGVPFLADQTDRDGRRKVVLMAAPAELVQRFLAGEIVPGLVDMYGDPARGFAGGYHGG